MKSPFVCQKHQKYRVGLSKKKPENILFILMLAYPPTKSPDKTWQEFSETCSNCRKDFGGSQSSETWVTQENFFEYERTFSGEPWWHSNDRFCWNNSVCHGHMIHLAALRGDVAAVQEQLEQGVSVHCVFYYETFYKRFRNLCNGQAIHLAASRGHLEVVSLLLNCHADINACMYSGRESLCNVIHAAVFSEGRGGSQEIIMNLSHMSADIWSKNLNGIGCMQIAFQTGNLDTIRSVEKNMSTSQWMGDDGDAEGVDFRCPLRLSSEKFPLEFRIMFGKMDSQALAMAAPLTSASLRIFVHQAPECIPEFMHRWSRIEGPVAEKLEFDINDIIHLMHDFPEAAASLIQSMACKPKVASEGWHPLPARVSFASRSWLGRRAQSLFPKTESRSFYEFDCGWDYDERSGSAPHWHHQLTDLTALREPPMYDAKIQVCKIPNIISPLFFGALPTSVDDEAALSLFASPVVRAAVSFTFWNGAVWMDMAQLLLGLWTLTLILIETSLLCGTKDTLDSIFYPSFIPPTNGSQSVVADWILARAIADLTLELAQLWGCVAIGKSQLYFNSGNLWDICRSILPLLLLFYPSNRALHVATVLIYWFRLLEGAPITRMGHDLLPLKRLLFGLAPTMFFTFLGFCTFTHAMFVADGRVDQAWSDVLFNSFVLLVTQGLPANPPEDTIKLLLLYVGVLVFSVFVLNIFIGIISEQLEHGREQTDLLFHSARTASCSTFLLRVRVLPCNFLWGRGALVLGCLAALFSMALQAAALHSGWHLHPLYQLLAFLLSQLTIFLSAIQCRGTDLPWESWARESSAQSRQEPWESPRPRSRSAKRYLWICEPRLRDAAALDLDDTVILMERDVDRAHAVRREPTGDTFRRTHDSRSMAADVSGEEAFLPRLLGSSPASRQASTRQTRVRPGCVCCRFDPDMSPCK